MEKIRKKRKIKSNTSVLLSPSSPKVNRVNKKHPPFSVWLVLASVMIGFYTVGFTNFLKTKSATTVWDFGTAVEYTYNAAFVEFVDGVARLIQIDQTDNDNDATTGFGAGTNSNTQWDAGNSWLELDATGLITNNANLASDWTPQWASLVSYWKMNNDGNDSKGSNNGTVNGATFSTSAKIGTHTGVFNGSTGQIITGQSQLGVTNAFTISAWVKTSLTTKFRQWIFAHRNDNNQANGVIDVILWDSGTSAPNKAYCQMASTAYQGVGGSTVILPNRWYYVTCTYDGSNFRIYVDGVQDATPTAITTTLTDLSANNVIGTQNPADVATSFNGSVDDVAVWNTALTSQEIQTIYNRQAANYGGYFTSRILDTGTTTSGWATTTWTPQMPYGKELPNSKQIEIDYPAGNMDMTGNVLLFHMNETGSSAQQGGTITDNSGSGNNGTLQTGSDGLTKTVSGTLNYALTFDGTNDYVSTNFIPTIGTGDITYSVWFKTGTSQNGGIMTLRDSDATPQISIVMSGANDGSVIGTKILAYTYDGATIRNAITTATYGDNLWHHAVLVHTTALDTLYVDGSVATTMSVANQNLSVTTKVFVGCHANGNSPLAGWYFKGAIDEASVFSRALSATEVSNIYKRGALNIKYQAMSCNDASCSGETWQGPDGTARTYFDESINNTIFTPSSTLTNIFTNQYFKYRAYFETASSTLSPELKSVTTTPNHYNGGDPTIINYTAPAYSIINSFTETLGSNNAGTIRYQLSPDNVYWHYWNDTSWASSTDGFEHANTSTLVNANILRFNTDVGTGSLYYKAFLRSVSSTQQVELDNISITTDPTIYFTSSSFSGTEADGTITISLNLSQILSNNSTVNYIVSTTATSTALGAGVDYTLANGTATILAGQTTTTFNIVLNNDTLDEDSETIVIDLSSPTNSILGTTTTLTYIITDNDDVPTIAFTSATGSGLESVTPANFELLLSTTSSKNITVDYVLTGTASGSGTDYTLTNGTTTITAGNVTTTVTATIVNDTLDEDGETIILTISNPTNSSLGVNTVHTYTITDDDNPPTIAFTSATASGAESITPVNIELSLSVASSKNITVDYVVTGTASGSGTDYTLANGTATITAGNTNTTITATIIDDTTDDNDETIILTISNPTDSSLGANTTHTYIITDNDDTPVVATPTPTQGGSGFSGSQSAPPTVIPITDTNIPETIPAVLSVVINNNAEKTNTTQVYLGLNGGNVKRMAISNTSDFQNIGQENYTQTKTWNLCFGKTNCQEGIYTVYIKFYSEFGISSNIITDTIIYTLPIETLTPPTIIIPPEFEKLPLKVEPIIPKEEIKKTPVPTPEEPIEIIPPPTEQEIRETKPELVQELEQTPTPLVLKEIQWDLIPFEPIRELLNVPFTGELANLVNKFPTLGQTFEQTGIKTMSDLNRLENMQLVLPNLSEVSQFRINDNIGTQLGEIIDLKTNTLPRAGTLASLSAKEKDKIPTEVVFANSASGSINISTRMTIDEKTKKPIQTITTVSGKKLELVVKPEHKVEKIKGYLVVKKIKKDETSLLHLFFSSLIQPVSAKEVQTEYVLLEFEYTDPDGDGIYTADIEMPVVEGEYEVITVMDYEDINLGNKEIRLVTVVDPEGYVYEKIGNREARMDKVTISIFYLNKETGQYELWPAKDFNQQNPQITDKTGKYSFLVPEGSYHLQAEANNYKTYSGAIFMVQEGSGIHENIELKVKNPWLKMLDWRMGLIAILFLMVSFMTYAMYSNIKSRSKLLKKMDEMEKSINNNKINN